MAAHAWNSQKTEDGSPDHPNPSDVSANQLWHLGARVEWWSVNKSPPVSACEFAKFWSKFVIFSKTDYLHPPQQWIILDRAVAKDVGPASAARRISK